MILYRIRFQLGPTNECDHSRISLAQFVFNPNIGCEQIYSTQRRGSVVTLSFSSSFLRDVIHVRLIVSANARTSLFLVSSSLSRPFYHPFGYLNRRIRHLHVTIIRHLLFFSTRIINMFDFFLLLSLTRSLLFFFRSNSISLHQHLNVSTEPPALNRFYYYLLLFMSRA